MVHAPALRGCVCPVGEARARAFCNVLDDVLVRGGHRTLMDGHTLRYITRRRGWLHLDATFGYSVGVTAG